MSWLLRDKNRQSKPISVGSKFEALDRWPCINIYLALWQLTFYSIASRKGTEAPGVFLGTAGYLDNWRIRVSQWKRQKTKALCLDLHVINASRQNFVYPSLKRSHVNENQRIYLVLKLKRTSVD